MTKSTPLSDPPSGSDRDVVIIGAGPAGLTAAYELCKQGMRSVIFEKDRIVGGLARTVMHRGYRFDVGGHRFFTKISAVHSMWKDVLGDDFLVCKRLSRIYYRKKFFYYPLRPANALINLGALNALLILLSYSKARLFPTSPEGTFEQWVSNRFGKRLYHIFFKTYTEKVWGIPCSEISADWGAQRIKGLSLSSALRDALAPRSNNGNRAIRTLIDTFEYPRHGPGMMWERVAQRVQDQGSRLVLGAEIEKISLSGNRIESVRVRHDSKDETLPVSHLISSMPLRELIHRLDPSPPDPVLSAASRLSYRDFVMVALVVDSPHVFSDNWIYIHDPHVHVGRIQNFKNWSPDMVPDPKKTCLGLEYFCFEGDGLWSRSDDELIELGKKELQRLGLVEAAAIEDGAVLRVPKAYPVYDGSYQESLETIRRFAAEISNLHAVGRNGMHRYNNQDHSMLTSMLAVKNILGGKYDLWSLNVDQEYQEELAGDRKEIDEIALLSSTQPRVPRVVR